MTKVTIVDAICGAGKTSWAIQYINEHPFNNVMYVTPFLDEINRVKKSTKVNFVTPDNKGDGKLSNLYDLIEEQNKIIATHKLFQLYGNNMKVSLENKGYVLILDEVMEVVSKVNIKKGDIDLLLKEGIISVKDNIVHWEKQQYYDTKYNYIKKLAESESLIMVNDRLMVWTFPVEIFKYFEEVYILTYKFDGSIMKCYYDFYNVEYIKKSVCKSDDKYFLSDYSVDYEKQLILQYRDLINIYYGNLNDIGKRKNSFSVTWLKNINNDEMNIVKNNIYNYFRNKVSGTSYDNMWTTFKDYKGKLKGKGYTSSYLLDENGEKIKDERNKEIKQECYIAFNARATNEFNFKQNLAYECNVYVHPDIKQFFNLKGIDFDEDGYAQGELIQWIFRSRIRNMESINIYIPNSRMRSLLEDWLLYNEEVENIKIMN